MNAPLFILNLAITVILLVLTVLVGRSGNRPRHYKLVAAALTSLALAIWQAEVYGKGFVFEETRLHIHLFFAITALSLVPGAIATGLALRVNPAGRRWHQRFVYSFLAMVGLAVVTAIFMFLNATSLAEAGLAAARGTGRSELFEPSGRLGMGKDYAARRQWVISRVYIPDTLSG